MVEQVRTSKNGYSLPLECNAIVDRTACPQEREQLGGNTMRRIRWDYPRALDNRPHNFFTKIEVLVKLYK